MLATDIDHVGLAQFADGNAALAGAKKGGTSSDFDIVANFGNSIIGAGIIGLPFALREGGFWMGIILLIVMAYINDYTVRQLIVCGKLSGKFTYASMMGAAINNKWGARLVSLCMFLMAYGAMIAYLVIVADSVPYIVGSLVDPNGVSLWSDRTFMTVLTTMTILLPVCSLRDITYLSRFSAFSLLCVVYIVATVLIYGPTIAAELPPPSQEELDDRFAFAHRGFFQAVAVIAFAYVCHHNSFLLFNAMKVPSLNRWATLTHISMLIAMAASMIMAVGGYLVFFENTQGNILNNFPANDPWANGARLAFAMTMLFTFPIETFVNRSLIAATFWPNQAVLSARAHYSITFVLVVTALIISLSFTDLGIVLELTGGSAATVLAFVFPALASLRLTSGRWWSPAKLPVLGVFLFGCVTMVMSTYLTIRDAQM